MSPLTLALSQRILARLMPPAQAMKTLLEVLAKNKTNEGLFASMK